MDKTSDFNQSIQMLILQATTKSKKTLDIGVLGKKQLLEILCFYRTYGSRDWFGCTGVIGIYNTYEYKYNYKKSGEIVYRFMSEYELP